ncbi:MAG TPA: ester cyclase, partial [bacterium]|nr:ester cyclase [bacterium]
FFGWTAASTVMGAPGDPQANIALVLQEKAMLNSMDFSRIGEVYSDQAVFHLPPNNFTDLAGYRQWCNTVFAQFPGAQTNYDETFAVGDKVVDRWTWSATLAPMGRKVTETGTSILRIADGKVVELWWNSDYLGVKLQAMAPLTAQEMENYLNMDYAIINAHDLATLGLFTTDQFVLDQVAANQVLTGKEALIGLLGALFQAFPDYHIETLRTLASEPAQVMVREIVQTGTHQGEFMGIPPTGKIGALRALILYEFVGNQLVRETQYADMASLMIQLGVMPAPTIPPLVPSFTLPDPEPTGLSPLEADAEFGARMNRHDAAGIAKMIHPEAKFVSGGIPLDRQGYVALSELYFQGFSDIHEEYTRRIDLGDGWIITENISHGTHDGVFLG